MNWTKRAAAVCLCALLTLGLSACTREGTDMSAAREKIASAKSLDSVFQMETDYLVPQEEGEDRSIQTVNRMEVTLFAAPQRKVKAVTTTSATSGEEEMSHALTIYMLAEGDGYMQYATDGTRWVKSATTEEHVESVSIDESVSLFLPEGVQFTRKGGEILGGVPAVKYAGTIQGASLVEVLDGAGLLGSISGMSRDQQVKIRANLENLKGQTVTVWLEESTGNPLRCEMDLTAAVAEMRENISATLGGYEDTDERAVTRAVLSLICSNYGAATDFTLPAEAADAELVS